MSVSRCPSVAPRAGSPLRWARLLAGFLAVANGHACAALAPTDACDTLCGHAQSRFEECLADNGLEWGTSVGFTSELDFADWCDTYVWEERQLDGGAQCASRQAIIDAGDCADWYTAWGDLE